MNIAVIDMGTNTFQLLVGKPDPDGFTPLFRTSFFVKIGKGGISEGKITDEAMERAIIALKKLQAHALEHGAGEIHATATSAIRSAKNSRTFLEKIEKETGILPRVIDGNEEAGFIYSGVRSVFDPGKEKMLILDIGGGSVEFIIADGETVFWKRSIEIGAQRLVDAFHHSDPIAKDELLRLTSFLDGKLEEVFGEIEKHQPKMMVGCAGTFDTVQDIYCQEKGLPKDGGEVFEVPISAYLSIHQQFVEKDRAGRLEIPGMLEKRVDMIVVASVLADFLLHKGGFEKLIVSKASLKEGVLYQMGKSSPNMS
ncbi:exopolyphosphatase [Flammeovirgaceae bacterium SG7u.111]|nr:exopolyphosphatase [Flammeovirgaceae bacterium SG7u.132]WPO35964.1 exopolyphosphatase [Flammeovirgaceae bacterium SG7u.111]